MAAGATYEPIATTTLSSAQSSVTFSSIPGTYTDLVLVGALDMTAALDFWFRVNSDTGTNYSMTRLTGNGTTAASFRVSNESKIYINFSTTSGEQNFIMHFMNYSNTTTYKTILKRFNNAASDLVARVGLWRSTSAITTILVQTDSSTFKAGSTFTLYGIAAA